MRKVLSLLLCVAMLCSLVVITAQADAAPAPVFADATTVPGGTIVYNATISSNPGLASILFGITDKDGLGATYEAADNTEDTLGLTANDAMGYEYWSGAVNNYNTTLGTITFTIPDDAELGEYEFRVLLEEGFDENGTPVALGETTFTITVTDKLITGANVSISESTGIGVHVQATDIEGVSITALDVAKKEYATISSSVVDEDTGDYIFYLNVNPSRMDQDFVIDFTDNFVIDEDGNLNMDQIPATAKTVGILSYCEALLAGSPSEELVQLIADLLAFGQAAQTYVGVAVMDLPAGLTPTEGEWLDGDENPTDFGGYCSENFPESISKNNATAAKKFKFASAKIEFGSKFVVTFTTANNGTTTANTSARMVVEGETYSLDGWNFTYALAPTQYAGIDFVLYATSTINNTNKAWTNSYGPAHYAAYVNDSGEEGSAAIVALLEAFYNYGVSAEAYVGSLGE